MKRDIILDNYHITPVSGSLHVQYTLQRLTLLILSVGCGDFSAGRLSAGPFMKFTILRLWPGKNLM